MKRTRITSWLIVFAFLILIVCSLILSAYDRGRLPDTIVSVVSNWLGDDAKDNGPIEEFQSAKLVRVVDGDTIVVEVSGREEKVRMIGIDTPESVASSKYLDETGKENTEEGERAADFVKTLLAHTETVYLQKDVSDTDRYGRLLRYVWLEIPNDENEIAEVSTKMLNGILVWEGIAEPAAYAPDTAHQEDFEYLADYREMGIEQQIEQLHGEKE